jgi:hypothetical protein
MEDPTRPFMLRWPPASQAKLGLNGRVTLKRTGSSGNSTHVLLLRWLGRRFPEPDQEAEDVIDMNAERLGDEALRFEPGAQLVLPESRIADAVREQHHAFLLGRLLWQPRELRP